MVLSGIGKRMGLFTSEPPGFSRPSRRPDVPADAGYGIRVGKVALHKLRTSHTRPAGCCAELVTGMNWKRSRYAVAALMTIVALSGCGTTYELPEPEGKHIREANAIFAEVRALPPNPQIPENFARKRFDRVTERIKPVAESYCLRETADRPNFNCDVTIGIDNEMSQRNAYFTYDRSFRPVIMVTAPMLRDMRNDHELAFVLGHEYGHLIGQHIQKGQQQALVGALILGGLAAVVTANDPYSDPNLISDNMELGYSLGAYAFSQEYELESDTLGTLITRTAGYDPVIGARFFARGEALRHADGRLSFWGTHPPDARRIATVLATVEQLNELGGIKRQR